MKYGIICILLLVATLAASSQETFEEKERVGDKTLDIELKFADDIKVNTWDKDEVLVKATVSINGDEDNDHFTFKKDITGSTIYIEENIEDMEDLQRKIVFTNKKGRENIYYSVDLELRYEIWIPEKAELKLETISGDIELLGCIGGLDVKTISGFIDYSVPASHAMDLHLKTITGGLYSNLDVEYNKGQFKWVGRDDNLRLNGGGVDADLETVSGDLFLRKK